MLIIWSNDANEELNGILEYFLGAEEADLGMEVVEDIFNSTDRLIDYPLMGRAGRWPNTRELICNSRPYIIIYEIMPDAIHILRVIHMSRLFPDAP
jgi:addiction module RelE/StbE family toxin